MYALSNPHNADLCLRSKRKSQRDWEIETAKASSGMCQGENVIIENSKRECALNYLGNSAHKLTLLYSVGRILSIAYFIQHNAAAAAVAYFYTVDILIFIMKSSWSHHHDDKILFLRSFDLDSSFHVFFAVVVRSFRADHNSFNYHYFVFCCFIFLLLFCMKIALKPAYIDVRDKWHCNGIWFLFSSEWGLEKALCFNLKRNGMAVVVWSSYS